MSYVDRQGREISEEGWKNLSQLSSYATVRQFARRPDVPGPRIRAAVRWLGYAHDPFVVELVDDQARNQRAESETVAISIYEDFLVTNDCGEWYPSGGCLDKNGKQIASTYTFADQGNEYRSGDMKPELVAAIAENPDFGSW
jgi:hypothetical protein